MPGEDHGSELLVVYDLPADDRLHADTAIDADVFRLERPGAAGPRAGAAPRRVT